MEEDTDDESHEEDEDEYVLKKCISVIHINMLPELVNLFNPFFFVVIVQMNIPMMKMSAGKFEGQLLNA